MQLGVSIAIVAAGIAAAFALGWFVRAQLGRARLRSAEQQAQQVLAEAARDAEAARRDAVLAGREEALAMKQELEREMLRNRNAQLEIERAFQQKEAAFNRRVELIDKKERDLKRLENELAAREQAGTARAAELERLVKDQTARLARVAGLTPEQAREEL